MNIFTRSVAGITASLAKMVKQLEDHRQHMLAKVEHHKKVSDVHLQQAADAGVEAEKAQVTADKIASLLS